MFVSLVSLHLSDTVFNTLTLHYDLSVTEEENVYLLSDR